MRTLSPIFALTTIVFLLSVSGGAQERTVIDPAKVATALDEGKRIESFRSWGQGGVRRGLHNGVCQ